VSGQYYGKNVLSRAMSTGAIDSGHNFPYTLDNWVLNYGTVDTAKSSATFTMYKLDGAMMLGRKQLAGSPTKWTEGSYEIGVQATKIFRYISHRNFQGK
jgi:hypothetical protein